MPLPADSAERVRRLRTLSHHAERAARGLAGGSLALSLVGSDDLGLSTKDATLLLAAHAWDVDAAFDAYKASRPPT